MTLHLSAYARGVYKLDIAKCDIKIAWRAAVRPGVFTEHGAIMLASVLNSEIAVQASVRVVRAFVRLREMVAANAQIACETRENWSGVSILMMTQLPIFLPH